MSNKRYVRVRIKTWYVCGCVDCRGHDGVTVKQVELPVADLSSGEIDRVVRHHFVD